MLLGTLAEDARILSALDDPEDSLWSSYSPQVRSHIQTLGILGGRQVRPVILAAISHLSPQYVETLIWYLIVVVVRFQIIGRGRTGVMEKVFGKLCADISSGTVGDPNQLQDSLQELFISDDEFVAAFATHTDSRLGRFAYFLAELELNLQPKLISTRHILAESSLTYLVNPRERPTSEAKSIGEFALVDSDMHVSTISDFPVLTNSQFSLTRDVSKSFNLSSDIVNAVASRARELAHMASSAWKFNK
jgi:hypothetical protein